MPSEFDQYAWRRAVERFDLTAFERLVLTHIDNKADGTTGENAYVTEASLAATFGKSERTARRALKRLREVGLIALTKRGQKGVGASVYRLTMPGPQPDISTGHEHVSTGHSQPDTGDVNRTFSTGHPASTGHPVTTSTGHRVSGISDPITRSSLRGSGYIDQPDISMSGVDASRPVGEGQEQSEPALRSVSSSTAIGTSSDVPLPDTNVSGVADHSQPATESEPMNDPWAPTATETHDDEIDYGALADEHYAALSRERETFEMGSGQFVGPETDPATEGPDWDRGPIQLP